MPNIDSNTIGQNDGGQLRHSPTKIHVELYKPLIGHKQGIYCAIETQTGLFTAGGEGAIVRWTWSQLANNEEPAGELWATIPEPIFCLASQEDTTVLAGTQKGNIYRLSRDRGPLTIKVDSQSVYFIRWWKDLYWVGTGSGKLAIFDRDLKLVEWLQLASKSLRSMEIFEDSAWIGCSDSNIYRLSINSSNPASVPNSSVESHTDSSSELIQANSRTAIINVPESREWSLTINQWSANHPSVFGIVALGHNKIVSVGRDAHVRLFSDTQLKLAVPAHLGTIHGLSSHPRLPWFATGSMDKSIKIWRWNSAEAEVDTIDLIKVINREKFAGTMGHSHSVNAVLWISPAGQDLLLKSMDLTNSSESINDHQHKSMGSFLLSVGDDRQGLLWFIKEF